MTYVYAVHVTILSKGDKFRLASSFMELHTLTLDACSYAFLYNTKRIARVIDCSPVGEHIVKLSQPHFTEKHKLSQIGITFHPWSYLLISNQSTPFSQNSYISQEANLGDGMLLPLVQGCRNAVLAKNCLESTRKFPTQSWTQLLIALVKLHFLQAQRLVQLVRLPQDHFVS